MKLEEVIFEVRDRYYERVGQIMPSDLTFSGTVLLNNVGNWNLSLAKEHHLVPTLRVPGAGLIVTGPDGTVLLSGPVTEPAFEATPEDTAGTIVFTGVTDDIILADRRAFPDPARADVTQQSRPMDERSGAAETLMHDFVNVNVGPGAHPERRHAYLTMGPNLGRGPSLTKTARFPVLGTLLGEISTDTSLGFQIRQGDGPFLIFSTYEVTDRTEEVHLSIQNGGSAGVKTTVSSPEFTRAILGGQTDEESRTFYEATNDASLAAEAEWGRRIEKFVNASVSGDGDPEAEFAQQGKEALAEGAMTSVNVELIPNEDSTLEFGREWGLGDKVTVELDFGSTAQAYVNGYAFKASAEEGFIFGAVMSDAITTVKSTAKKVDERISNIERNGVGGGLPTVNGVSFEFPTATTTWVCTHNLSSTAVIATCFDSAGKERIGDLKVIDANTVHITWYYPTSGSCRVSK